MSLKTSLALLWSDGLDNFPGPEWLSQVTKHNHFDILFSRPFGYEDRRPKLKAWEGEPYTLWKTPSSPILNGHLMSQMVM